MLTTLLFDLDNTLLDRDAALRAALRQFTASHPAAFPPHRRARDLDELVRRDHHGWTPWVAFYSWMEHRFPALGQTGDQAWRAVTDLLVRNVQPTPGVPELLADLSRRYQVAIVTNGSTELQRAKAERAGIDGAIPWFDSQAAGVAKPAPALFQRVVDQLGCRPGQTLHVGDDPRRDIGGAAAAGLHSCWITLGEPLPEDCSVPDCCVDHVLQLGELL